MKNRLSKRQKIHDSNNNSISIPPVNVKFIPLQSINYSMLKTLKKDGENKTEAKNYIKNLVSVFQTKFGKKYNIIIGDHCFTDPSKVDNELDKKEIAESIFNNLSVFPEESELIAAQIIKSLGENDTHAIWFLTGGDPSRAEVSALKMKHILQHLHAKSPTFYSAVKFPEQKSVIGYCYPLPLMYYLGARGLARVFHGPLGSEISELTQDQITRIKSAFENNYSELTIQGLEPQNDAAHNFFKDEKKISASVIGGLLQNVSATIKYALSLEDEIAEQYSMLALINDKPLSIISGKPIVLFIEALEFGNEKKEIEILKEHFINKRLDIKAICIGDLKPRSAGNLEGYRKVIKELADFANSHGVPLCTGLKAGHGPRGEQIVIPLGAVDIKIDKQNSSLKLTYQSVTVKDWSYNSFPKFAFWSEKETNKRKITDNLQIGNGPFNDNCCIM